LLSIGTPKKLQRQVTISIRVDSIVDEVTVTPYQERGGGLEDLNKTNLEILEKYLSKNNLSKDTPYMIDGEGNLFISII